MIYRTGTVEVEDMPITLNCACCGVEVRRAPSNVPASGRVFCSNECFHRGTAGQPRRPRARKVRSTTPCAHCGKMVERVVRSGMANVYCDTVCGNRAPKKRHTNAYPVGAERQQWNGYVEEKTERGWQAQHRVVMERALGRELYAMENVHHKNGLRSDNRLENLELWVVGQPKGQRVEDVLAWARLLVATYGSET